MGKSADRRSTSTSTARPNSSSRKSAGSPLSTDNIEHLIEEAVKSWKVEF